MCVPCSAIADLILAYFAINPGDASKGGSSLDKLRSGVQSNAMSTGRELEPVASADMLLLMISISLNSERGVQQFPFF